MSDFDIAGARIAAAVRAAATQRRAGERPRTRAEALRNLTLATRPRSTSPARASLTGVVRLDVDDEIGAWGIKAAAFGQQLRDVPTGTGTIELHVNCPGGDVFDGLAMMNALADHPARVEVVVDGIAASAASYLILAGDHIRMNRGTQLMIHDAATVTGGNEADHLRGAELLGRVSNTIAELYARRAGGTTEEWRELMRAETWFNAEEAVAAGLADEVAADQEPATALSAAKLQAALRGAFA